MRRFMYRTENVPLSTQQFYLVSLTISFLFLVLHGQTLPASLGNVR
jgi:hypothetical protein